MPDTEQATEVLEKEIPSQEKEKVPQEEILDQEKRKEKATENFNAAQRRIERKQWKQLVAQLESQGITDQDQKEAAELAKSLGFELSDESSKKNVELITKVSGKIAENQRKRITDARLGVARENLKETLAELGYNPGTPEHNAAGSFLFGKLGVEDPDIFLNKEMVEKEIESFHAPRRKGKDSVGASVEKRAGLPQPSSTSRVKNETSGEVKEVSSRMGVNEDAAKQIAELRKNLPKRFQ